MNVLFDWLNSAGWSTLVTALLHTLWQAAVVAMALWAALRWIRNPVARYRLSVGSLAVTFALGSVTWAWLLEVRPSGAAEARATPVIDATSPWRAYPTMGGAPSEADAPATSGTAKSGMPLAAPLIALPLSPAWLAAAWLTGAGLMLVRAARQVAGAGSIQRESRPLVEGPVFDAFQEAVRLVGLQRRIRLAVTEQLTSPAVVGVLVPTLMVPLSLMTTLTPVQIRYVLLHELAHIQRADYLVNLGQLLVESLLFFNPAMWWISRQVRLEREACCDALAIALSGTPEGYALTLVEVAERQSQGVEMAAMAFGDARQRSSLSDRVRRLLVPGYSPELRLSWKGMILTGGACAAAVLFLEFGTRLTVATILTPRERIDRALRLAVAHGEWGEFAESNRVSKELTIAGRLRTEDGSPVPSRTQLTLTHATRQSSSVSSLGVQPDGSFRVHTQVAVPGTVTLSAEAPGYAPSTFGPTEVSPSNGVENIDLVLHRGFSVRLQVVDADSGFPIGGASLQARFWPTRGSASSFSARELVTDSNGLVSMTQSAELPLQVTAQAPGYATEEQRYASPKAGQTLTVKLSQGLATAGRVVDRMSGQPLPRAVVRILYQQGPQEYSRGWDSDDNVIAAADQGGHFTTSRLRRDTRYWLGVSADQRASAVISGVLAGDTNLIVHLGPELVVRGVLKGIPAGWRTNAAISPLTVTAIDLPEPHLHSAGRIVAADWDADGGSLRFAFTNRLAGRVELSYAGRTFAREVDAPISDWTIDWLDPVIGGPLPTATGQEQARRTFRKVVLRFEHDSGVPPEGAVEALLPYLEDTLGRSFHFRSVPIREGRVEVEVPVGTWFECRPSRATLGYWFDTTLTRTNIPPGVSPLDITVPVVPAGAISARAYEVDGDPSANLSFSVVVAEPAKLPSVANFSIHAADSWSATDGPRRFLSPPLPLGGIYQVVGWRGNSFCASLPIRLTEEDPHPSVKLHFAPTRAIEGTVLGPNGRAVRGAEVVGTWRLTSHGFGLKPVMSDESGRFTISDASPDVGHYLLEVRGVPYAQAQRFEVDFTRLPLVVQLQPGLVVTGQVIDTGTLQGVGSAKVRAWDTSGQHPSLETVTDPNGHFGFTALADASYQVSVEGRVQVAPAPVHPKRATNLVVRVAPR